MTLEQPSKVWFTPPVQSSAVAFPMLSRLIPLFTSLLVVQVFFCTQNTKNWFSFLQEAYAPPSDKEALQYLRKYGYLSGLKFLAIRSSVNQIVVQDL